MNILELEHILEKYPHQNYERGDIIFNEGDECQKIGIIQSGDIKITTITMQDHEETISYLTKGEIFGNHLIFSSHPYYLGDVICEKKATIIFINKNELIKLLQTNESFLVHYFNEMSNKAIHTRQQLKMMAHKSLTDRLMYYLFMLSKQQGTKKVKIPTITKIAIELSVPRPSLARIIKKLVEDGLIKYEKHFITIK